MMVLSATKARTEREWRGLLGEVDGRLGIVGMRYSKLGSVVAGWVCKLTIGCRSEWGGVVEDSFVEGRGG